MNFTVEGARFGQTDGVQQLRKYEIGRGFGGNLATDPLTGLQAYKKRAFSPPRHRDTEEETPGLGEAVS
jgi:hypothetical protein